MAPVATPEPSSEPAFELPVHARLPRLDLAVDWGSPWAEFRSSIGDLFHGPPAPKYEDLPKDSDLRVDWVRDRFSFRSFLAACLWHVAIIALLLLPIWGFLPQPDHNLAPVHIELTYVPDAGDLPKISLPAPGEKSKSETRGPDRTVSRGADAFHPRQTIVSVPVRITHPRQTLIQPAAPAAPPKIDVPLPNVVQWTQSSAPPEPRLHYNPSVSAPLIRRRAIEEAVAPDIPNSVKNPGALNIAPSAAINPAPQMPLMPMSAARATARRVENDRPAPAAPDINVAASSNSNLPSIVALSASPAPPAPVVNVPRGNLAARVSISPEGARAGAPGGNPSAPPSRGNASLNGARGESIAGGSGGNSSNLPAAVSVSGGGGHTGPGGGIAPSGIRSGLILRPMTGVPERPQPMMATPKTAADIAHLDPGLPPEALLSGKQVYTLHVNLPNLTSVSGSWILHFSQFDDDVAPYLDRGALSAPEAILVVDPEYPPEAIKQHIDGEVVLYAIIRKDGSVDSIQLVKGIDPRLDGNAMKAFSKWKFKPGTRNGKPVDLEAVVHIPFFYRKPDD
ncbi:MAG TPA: TonB family protein [Verrucomicrobiae bacterium]|nr:TonB family protein [Verrucomicrobiae bacterium]